MFLKANSLLLMKTLKVHVSLRLLVTCLGTLCWFQVGLLVRLTDWTFNTGHRQGVWKRVWDSWIPIPAGVGFSLLAYLQWRRLQSERNNNLRIAHDWEVTCYKALPLRTFSRAFGLLTETYIPVTLRPYVYTGYARAFGVNLTEVAQPVDYYSCLGSFFTRKLKEGARPIDQNKTLVSPADGTVLTFGRVKSFQIEQVKGVTYSLKAFLGDLSWKRPEVHRDVNANEIVNYREGQTSDNWTSYKEHLLQDPENNDLFQAVIYLAPGDYHRFHSPADWHVSYRRHFTGELLSVNPSISHWIPGLFVLNERALYVGSWKYGYFSMTAVGATNVGSIRVYDDEALQTNVRGPKRPRVDDANLDLNWGKGEDVGEFRMGSTLVLVFEAPKDFSLDMTPNQRVQVGQGISV